VLSAAFPNVGIGLPGVALAFGLTVLTMAYALGHLSGCHLNPAVTCGLVAGGRFKRADALPYIVAQVVGAVVAAGLLYVIASGRPGFDLAGGLAANGYGEHSPGGYSLGSCFLTEMVMTFMFLIIILGATDGRAPQGFAPIAIGPGLTLIHLVSIPVTSTSVNPAGYRRAGPSSAPGSSSQRFSAHVRHSLVRIVCSTAWRTRRCTWAETQTRCISSSALSPCSCSA